jgi:cell division protein FtsN
MIIVTFVLGLLIGMVINGIHINIIHKHEQPKPTNQEYNESLVDLLPNDVKQYYHENNGRNNF